METIRRIKIKYQWEHCLTYIERQEAVILYLKGYAVSNIADSFHVTPSTIEYHIRQEGYYLKGRNPFPDMRGKPIQRLTITTTTRHIHFNNQRDFGTFNDTPDFYFDEYGERYRQPKSYAQIFLESKQREAARKQTTSGRAFRVGDDYVRWYNSPERLEIIKTEKRQGYLIGSRKD